MITAGTDVGNQGGQAAFAVGAINDPSDRCFLEVDNSKKFVNGGNFEFCTNIAVGDPDPCGAVP